MYLQSSHNYPRQLCHLSLKQRKNPPLHQWQRQGQMQRQPRNPPGLPLETLPLVQVRNTFFVALNMLNQAMSNNIVRYITIVKKVAFDCASNFKIHARLPMVLYWGALNNWQGTPITNKSVLNL